MDQELLGLALFCAHALGWEWRRRSRAAQVFERAYWAERKGRARVELEMKRLTEVRLNTDAGFFVQPIGSIASCYRQCIGTPRQGLLVPASRASLTLTTNISPEILDGLHEFTHVWLTFKFHLNTNSLKEAKAFTPLDHKQFTFKAKIFPPMLKEKKGVFATRSPHRPNPIGVTLARIASVDKARRTVHLTACDLVEGTPVLDIKPYVGAYDSVPDARVPRWIDESIHTRNRVTVDAAVHAQVAALQDKLRQFKHDPIGFTHALVETIEADVRSKFQTRKRMGDSSRGVECEVPFDNLLVRFLWLDERVFEITSVALPPDSSNFEFASNEVDEVEGLEEYLRAGDEDSVDLDDE